MVGSFDDSFVTAQPLMPPELTDLIIDFLHDDHTGLKNCGLVCRQWLPTAQYHFFRTISSIQLDHGKKFLKLLESSPHIGRYVHTLVDLSPKPYGDVAKYLVNLHTLDLSYSMLDRFEELTKMLSHLASLRELRLFHCLFQVENIEMVTAPIDIDTLRITVPSFDVAEFMEWAATANMFQRVQTFSFIGRGGHSNENLGLCSLLSTTATTLRNVDLSTLNSAHVDDLLDAISGLTHLETLVIRKLHVVAKRSVQYERSGIMSSEKIPQFFSRVTSHSMKHFSLELCSFALADGPHVLAGIWKQVAQIIGEPRFAGLAGVTVTFEGILWEQRDLFIEPLLPLQQSGLVVILRSEWDYNESSP